MNQCSDGIAKPANKGKLPKTERGQGENGWGWGRGMVEDGGGGRGEE